MAKPIGEWVKNWIEECAMSGQHDIQIVPGYAEPGHEPPKLGVILANWNHFTSKHSVLVDLRAYGKREIVPTQVTGTAGDILERYGYGIEWSDEWAVCSDCGKCVRTSPDCFSWKPSFYWEGSDIVCKNCALADLDRYAESLENSQQRDTWSTDFGPAGFHRLPQQFAFLIDLNHPNRGQSFILAEDHDSVEPNRQPLIWVRRPDDASEE